MTTEG